MSAGTLHSAAFAGQRSIPASRGPLYSLRLEDCSSTFAKWAGSSRTTGLVSSSSQLQRVRLFPCLFEDARCTSHHTNVAYGTDQIGSAIEDFIWPKVFWDFTTTNLNGAVKPSPVFQIFNLVLGLLGIALEWPLQPLAGTVVHRSIEYRMIIYPLNALFAALIYQGMDPALYYLIGIGVYFWAYTEGEVCFSSNISPAAVCRI